MGGPARRLVELCTKGLFLGHQSSRQRPQEIQCPERQHRQTQHGQQQAQGQGSGDQAAWQSNFGAHRYTKPVPTVHNKAAETAVLSQRLARPK